jgi:hypothetical protein
MWSEIPLHAPCVSLSGPAYNENLSVDLYLGNKVLKFNQVH